VHKAFQIILITFLVIFTAVGLIIAFSAVFPLVLARILPPIASGGGGASFSYVFAVKRSTIQIVLILILVPIVLGIYRLSRRRKLR